MSLHRNLLTSWSAVTASHPRYIIAFAITCNLLLTLSFILNLESFSFDEPLRGFEARGSSLSNRINTWKLITGRTNSIDDEISLYPRRTDANATAIDVKKYPILDDEEELEKKRIAAMRMEEQSKKDGVRTNFRLGSTVGRFCGELTDSYVQFVIEPRDPAADMFALEYLQETCEIDRRLRSMDQFASSCVTNDGEQHCCRSWSLPNLIARFSNKTDCSNLTTIDVVSLREVLDSCAEDYRRKSLHRNCFDEPKSCPQVPPICFAQENLIFNLFHYILESDFVDRNQLTTGKLKLSNIFPPLAKSSNLLPFFHQLDSVISPSDLRVRVASFDIGLKDTLFEKLLLEDTRLVAIAYVSVLAIVWIYTKSLSITILTLLNLVASLGAATLLYKFVYRIEFFPFMNLMTVILLIAVGTDSTFIFTQAWQLELDIKSRRPLQDHLNSFFKRTIPSTLLSNATTCLALISSVISDITSLKCFSVFSSTAILALYILTTVTVPAVLVVLSDDNHPDAAEESRLDSSLKSCAKKIFNSLFQMLHFSRYFLAVIMVFALSLLTPLLVQQFRLPDSDHFSIFYSNHPFETFDTKYRDLFKFSHRISDEETMFGLPITIVFGIKAADNGKFFDPFSRGHLELDPQFDASTFESQVWMLRLCQTLRNVSFYKPTHGPLLSNCFVETFKTWIEDRPCFDHIMNTSNVPCCRNAKFPYDRKTFETCVPKAIEVFHRTPTFVISREGPGVRFSPKDSKLVAVIVQYSTNFTFSNAYNSMKSVVDQIEQWLTHVLSGAPAGIRSGFFVSENLELLALQESLMNGTWSGVLIALLLAYVCIFIVTSSFLLTLVTLITIAAIITSTLVTLVVVFEWQFNVIESVAILVAIGISVDLPLHYIIAFQRQNMENLCNKTLMSLCEVGGPLFAASLTTACAGLWMICSQILAYIRVGTFLVVISFYNVLFTFVFLTSLLLIIEQKAHSSSRQSQIEFLRNDLPLNDY